ncbi:hypothetical protein [Sphingomonas jatrophae]|uniref:Uncharacterized protein n=1 Tax=Sphingomonas jatrophae TaxID=1166337 RepID=A0A1I6L2P4_9SPHN|nr:hypothetical protein [Sphingomonas jatrophae]SFR97702.1 hypothetical protein SAMN05192580_2196 [Sphingomonas jatrophae]
MSTLPLGVRPANPTRAIDSDQTDALASLTASADAIASTAQRLLSSAFAGLFMRWAVTAAALSGMTTDEEGNQLCSELSVVSEEIATLAPGNSHDLALKLYLLIIEAADASCMGPVRAEAPNPSDSSVEHSAKAVLPDLERLSGLPAMIEDMAEEAWRLSGSPTAWSAEVRATVADAFSAPVQEAQ